MSKSIQIRTCVAATLVCLLGASCSDVTDSDSLPGGKYPMIITASVDGLTATRAITDGDSKTSWEENDPVAISMDGGANHKEYKISNAGTGAMIPNDEANTLYWSKQQETLAAWHPVSCIVGNGGGSEVNITDQHSGFGTLENILHAPAKDYTYSSGNSVAFVFRHALAKVKVTLKKGECIEENDLSSATVSFTGYTAGSLGYGGMTGSGSNGDINPKTETPSGGAATYTALVIPQQMQGKKFIKVTIGADGAARDYYYTPAGSTDANLEAGKQYTYTITVKKTGLEVTVTGNATAWTDESVSTDPDKNVTLRITAPPEGVTITASDGTLEGSDGSYTLSGGNNITVTIDVGSNSNKFLSGMPAKGIYEITSVSRTDNNYTYAYTLKGDISFSDPVFTEKTRPALGDYYYFDGTWSAELWWEKPCIGIVFKGEAGNNDAIDDYSGSGLTGQINGYVVSLQDAARFDIKWSTVQENCGTSTETDDYKGYSNTAKILTKSGYNETTYPVCWATTHFGDTTPAPSNTSGWYLPSAGQMTDIVNAWKSNGIIRQKLDALPYNYTWKIPTTEHGYATSTEDSGDASRNIKRIDRGGNAVNEGKYYGNFAVRPVLTF